MKIQQFSCFEKKKTTKPVKLPINPFLENKNDFHWNYKDKLLRFNCYKILSLFPYNTNK